MPKPIFKSNDIIKLVNENILLMNKLDSTIEINLESLEKKIFIKSDLEQLNRVFINLFKNSIESLNEKSTKNPSFSKKIDIEIIKKDDYIEINLIDNGIGFNTNKVKDLLKPYFTTKINGSGLGLPIINKIINDHNGNLKLIPGNEGAKIKINLPT